MPSIAPNLASPYLLRPSSPPPSYSAAASSPSILQGSPETTAQPPGGPLDSSAFSTPKLSTDSTIPPGSAVSALHPQVAVILGVKERWHLPLQLCRCLSMIAAIWWGMKCLWIFLELIFVLEQTGDSLRLRLPARVPWDLARRLEVTEVLLATVWCAASAYLSFFFADCLMSRWLLLYDAKATLVRLSTISMLNVYITNLLMQICGTSTKPSRLLPAWIFITVTLTVLYHLTQRHTNIKRETSAARRAFWFAMEVSLFILLLQLHFPWDLAFGA